MAGGQRQRLKSTTNFSKPGSHVKPAKKEDEGPRLGPIVIGLFIFVVIGSAFIEVLRILEGDKGSVAPPDSINMDEASIFADEDVHIGSNEE